IANLAGAGDHVIHVRERDARAACGDEILTAIRQCDLTASFERDSVLDEFEMRIGSSRDERDGSCVIDDTAQRPRQEIPGGTKPGGFLPEEPYGHTVPMADSRGRSREVSGFEALDCHCRPQDER